MKNEIELLEYTAIADAIPPHSKILDLGCGGGNLMEYLVNKKSVNAQGLEIDQECVYECVGKGLTVFQSDIETGLDAYPDDSFDFIIMFNSLQQIKNIDAVIKQCFRIGRNLIIAFPNFGQMRSRLDMLIGQTPITKHLPYRWYNSPNIRFLTIKDFRNFCKHRDYKILHSFFFTLNKQIHFMANLFAYTAVFMVGK
jgi:methionine biosynthesis protein MetW